MMRQEKGPHAMSSSPESVVRQFLAATHSSNVDAPAGFFSAGAVSTDGPRGTYTGINAIKAISESQVQVTPSLDVDVKTLVANGTTVFVEWVDSFEMRESGLAWKSSECSS